VIRNRQYRHFLGEKLASLFSDDAALAAELLQASKVTNEGLWQMPLEKSYSSQLKSTIANLKNIGGNLSHH
jgi:leucyl aminopeptidase